MPLPIDYFRREADRGGPPRLSKLAVAGLVISFTEGAMLCGPLLQVIRIAVPIRLQSLAIFAIPVFSLSLCVLALVRIIRSMDNLRGEGLAITGIIASFVICMMVLILT